MTIGTESGRTFSAGFFSSVSFFSEAKEKVHPKKLPRNPVNKNLIKVRRNTSPQEPRKNHPKRRQSQPYTQISKVDMSSNTQNYKHRKRFEDIKKQV